MAKKQYFIIGRFLDGSGAAVQRNILIEAEGGIITAIGPVGDLPPQENVAITNLSHCTAVPALVDCSVALGRSPSLATDIHNITTGTKNGFHKSLFAQHLHYCHSHGVLGIGQYDDKTAPLDYEKRQQQTNITLRLGGGESIDKQAISEDRSHSDFKKILYSSNIEDNLADQAQSNQTTLHPKLRHTNTKWVAVANGRQHVTAALDAGCDAIEQGYGMGEENLRTMARNKVLWIPSLIRAKNSLDGAGTGGDVCCRFSLRYVAPGKPIPGAEALWKKTLNAQLAQLRLARTLGVTTAMGTGAGSPGILHGESMVEEMKLFIKAGYSLPEAIRCASENGARFFDMKGLGALSVGQPATFLVTRGTVQQLPRKLTYLEAIYINGSPSISDNKY